MIHCICCGCRWYKEKAGNLHDKHPVHDYYIGAMFMDQGGYAQLKAFAKERPPTDEEVGSLHHFQHIAAVLQALHGVAWYCR
jgi:hypothetical protein